MKMLLLSLAVSVGVMLYISSGKNSEMLKVFSQPKKAAQGAPAQAEGATQAQPAAAGEKAQAQEERMVQIQGKWYKYRADNRYVINGIPTYHVPKKLKPKEEPVRTVAAQPAVNGQPAPGANPNLQKSQALIQMAGENPMKVYTPEGLKALKDGLDAMKNSAAEEHKALEALMKEN